MATDAEQNTLLVRPDKFPADEAHADGTVGGVPTEVMRISHSDSIIVTVSQDGRLSEWVEIPLGTAGPAATTMPHGLPPDTAHPTGLVLPQNGDDDFLPPIHVTPRTLIGGRGDGRELVAHLYATHVAGQLSLRNPEDRRSLTFGIGLQRYIFDVPGPAPDGGDAAAREGTAAAAAAAVAAAEAAAAAAAAATSGEEKRRTAHFDLIELLQKVVWAGSMGE